MASKTALTIAVAHGGIFYFSIAGPWDPLISLPSLRDPIALLLDIQV
jgi:hypothetical protein